MAIYTLPPQLRRPKRVQDFFPGLRISESIPVNYIRNRVAFDLTGGQFIADYVFARSARVPSRFIGAVKDFNINFTTAGTGVLKIVIINDQESIINEVVQNISSSSSGVGFPVFTGQAVGVAVQTSGTGTLRSIDMSGDWVYIGQADNA